MSVPGLCHGHNRVLWRKSWLWSSVKHIKFPCHIIDTMADVAALGQALWDAALKEDPTTVQKILAKIECAPRPSSIAKTVFTAPGGSCTPPAATMLVAVYMFAVGAGVVC